MPFADPAVLDLGGLFRDPGMFDSRRSWAAAGFQVVDRANNGKIMVARHPSAQGLIFKKYANDLSQGDQTKNYERRVDGANRLRAFVDAHRLERVAIPRKWILKLPFSRRESSHVLIAEQLELLNDDQTKAAYARIDPGHLRDLCVVLFHFRGMDSNAKNIPFTTDGKIALIDTEHWDRKSSKSYLHHVGEYLSAARKKVAKKIFRQLEDGGDGTVHVGDFSDEDTSDSSESSDSESSDSRDDVTEFVDEEDTSPSSSS